MYVRVVCACVRVVCACVHVVCVCVRACECVSVCLCANYCRESHTKTQPLEVHNVTAISL